MTNDEALVPIVEPASKAEAIPETDDGTAPKIGRWYWITGRGYDSDTQKTGTIRWLACVIHVGSNYAELKSVTGGSNRIHFNVFWDRCEFVADPQTIIMGEIAEHQDSVKQLMAKVHEITSRLAISTGPALTGDSTSEASALTLRKDQPMDEYKAALILAQKKTLPELFKEIEESNNSLACWMKANLIPLLAEAKALDPTIDAIKDRIFNVELYAGLVEKVEQITDGEPAPYTEKIHLMQRRAYMDEECLARYETGGMEFKDIHAFDQWLARPDNLKRLLPHPKCALAFRVRRHEKERAIDSLAAFISIMDGVAKADELTFLYIRNGEQLFRMSTDIEFGPQLFPDMGNQGLSGKLWARVFAGCVNSDKLISDNEYQGILGEEAETEAEIAKLPEEEQNWRRARIKQSDEYVAFTPETVYYDDIAKKLQEKAAKHNRLVLVLQGLLDRSPVFHPHPPWSLWTNSGFEAALTLVYDKSRVLTTGDKPDFEAYRAKLNASLRTGSVTVGQEKAWERAEAEKECTRRENDYRGRSSEYRPEYYHPYGNPGPGTLAKVKRFSARGNNCTYSWLRPRAKDTWRADAKPELRCTFTTKASKVLNVDAYKPGDFKIFFDDPRTRSEYLEWAWLLLTAEEYHAGNRKLSGEKVIPVEELPPDDDGYG